MWMPLTHWLTKQPQQSNLYTVMLLIRTFPSSQLKTAQNHPVLAEFNKGETYNGHRVSCDNWMNINLRKVIYTYEGKTSSGGCQVATSLAAPSNTCASLMRSSHSQGRCGSQRSWWRWYAAAEAAERPWHEGCWAKCVWRPGLRQDPRPQHRSASKEAGQADGKQ